MKILKVEYRNFNSYGNKITTINFTDSSSMNMLIGQSGFGKSTIREVISYLLYGKVLDKKLSDLPNRINKSLWGKITLIANNSTIVIERGINPKIFEVTIDNVVQDVAGNLNIQNIIENDYLKIPQITFDNIISISVDKFKSFLSMSPSDKRKILDQIFGIMFFNKIHDSLKENTKEFSNEIRNLEGQVSVLMSNKQDIEKKIKAIDEELSKDVSVKLEEVLNEISKLTEKLNDYSEKSKLILEKSSVVSNKTNELVNKRNEYLYKIKDCNHKLKLYENDFCPTCNSNLNVDFHSDIKKNIISEKEQLQKNIDELNENINSLQKVGTEIQSKNKQVSDYIFNCKIELNKLNSSKEELSKPKPEFSEFNSVLENTINRIESILNNIDENRKNEYLYSELVKIFGEDGVKLQIMKNFLPSFNKSINEISKKLHFPYKVEIDEKFNSKLTSIGEEINTKTLSTGERKKADFAVLVSLIYVIKRNYPNINLLFLDEVLSSIDSYGVYEMLNLIRSVVDELHLTTFIVNHSELQKEMFDYVYTVNKVAGFSELSIEKC